MSSPSEQPSVTGAASGGAMRHVVVALRAWGETVFWAVVLGLVYGAVLGFVTPLLQGEVEAAFAYAAFGAASATAIAGALAAVSGLAVAGALGAASAVRLMEWGSTERLGRRASRLLGATVAGLSFGAMCWGSLSDGFLALPAEVVRPGWLWFCVVPAVVAAVVLAWRTPTILTAEGPTLASRDPAAGDHGADGSRTRDPDGL